MSRRRGGSRSQPRNASGNGRYIRHGLTRMKISIAMCTYNGAEFLPAQLQSIVTQSRPPDEIVICDDGSTDDTRAVVERFAGESSIPITLHINDRNLGSVKNFERAI